MDLRSLLRNLFFHEIFPCASTQREMKKWILWKHFYYCLFLDLFVIRRRFIFLELHCHCPNNFFMKFIFSSFADGNQWEKFHGKRDFATTISNPWWSTQFFCSDSKYEICLKTNEDYSLQNPSNITQKMSQIRYWKQSDYSLVNCRHSFRFLKVATQFCSASKVQSKGKWNKLGQRIINTRIKRQIWFDG